MRTALLGLVLLFSSVTRAEPPVSPEAWTPASKLWLARALVGESGWDNRLAQAAVAWVLAKRRATFHPEWTMERMVRAYSCPIKRSTPRPWLRTLPANPDRRPRGWRGDWAPYAWQWADVLEFVDSWAHGSVPDPLPRAMHWGGTEDPVLRGCATVGQKGMVNTFYACGRSPRSH